MNLGAVAPDLPPCLLDVALIGSAVGALRIRSCVRQVARFGRSRGDPPEVKRSRPGPRRRLDEADGFAATRSITGPVVQETLVKRLST